MDEDVPKLRKGPEIATQYDSIGDSYNAMRDRQTLRKDLRPSIVFIDNHLKEREGKSLADIGCGGGHDLERYKTYGFAHVSGVDPSVKEVAATCDRLDDANIASVGDWTKLPYENDSQDYLVGRSTIHYVENLDDAYREAARVLKPGGKLIIIAVHPNRANENNVVEEGGREFVRETLDGSIPIMYPRHSMEEYFSSTLNELFEIVENTVISTINARGENRNQVAFVAKKR